MSFLTRRIAGKEHSPRRMMIQLAVLVLVIVVSAVAYAARPEEQPAVDPAKLFAVLNVDRSLVAQNVEVGDKITLRYEELADTPVETKTELIPFTHDKNGAIIADTSPGAVERLQKALGVQITQAATPGPPFSGEITVKADVSTAKDRGLYGVLRTRYWPVGNPDLALTVPTTLYLNYDPKSRPDFSFTDDKPVGGPQVVGVYAANDGNRSASPPVKVQLRKDGKIVMTGSAPEGSNPIIPGRERIVVIRANVPAGSYDATFTLGTEKVTGKVRITAPPAQQAAGPASTEPKR